MIISLAGLWMVDNQALRSMALGAMTVVAVSILTATTLLPTLIAFLGDRVMPGRPRRPGSSVPSGAASMAARPAQTTRSRVQRRWRLCFWALCDGRRTGDGPPWVAVIGVDSVLLFLAVPLLSIETGTEAVKQFPKGSDVRVGNELASEKLGGGADPIQIVAEFEARPIAPRSARSSASSSRLAGCQLGPAAGLSPAESVLFQATSNAPSESDAAQALVERLRDSVVPSSRLAEVATVDVGGETARSDESAPRSAARCGRSSSSSSPSASSS